MTHYLRFMDKESIINKYSERTIGMRNSGDSIAFDLHV